MRTGIHFIKFPIYKDDIIILSADFYKPGYDSYYDEEGDLDQDYETRDLRGMFIG